MLIGLIPKAERESRQARAILAYLSSKQIRHVAASQNHLHVLLNSLDGGHFPWGIGAAIFQAGTPSPQTPFALYQLAGKGACLGAGMLWVYGAEGGRVR